jgi:methyltransferase-like protein
MDDSILASYEELPYDAQPQIHSHPDVLATVGTLMGMTPPPLDRCRVLELGCANGANLLPVAMTCPQAQLVGIDLSPRQIGHGQAMIRELAVANLTLKAMSILDVDESFGVFDYIVCHGVFSWVPEAVQEKILAICSRHLSSNGIAYVSYNTYPGWHLRGLTRDMVTYQARQVPDPHAKVQRARAYLESMASALQGQNYPHTQIVLNEASLLRARHDAYVYHEHLEAENRPVYFHEFASRCRSHGLRHMADATPGSSAIGVMPPAWQRFLEQWGTDPIDREQNLDFLLNRSFRRSLLCREGVSLRPLPAASSLMQMHLSSQCRPASTKPDLTSSAAEKFTGKDGGGLSTDRPPIKAALGILCESHPNLVHFAALVDQVRSRLSGGGAAQVVPEQLAESMLASYLARMVDIHLGPPAFTTHLSKRPVAFALARYQAGKELSLVSCLRHCPAELSEFDRKMLARLDGANSQDDLLAWLGQAVAAGQLALQQDGRAVTDPQQARPALRESLQSSLKRLAHKALLVA